MTVRAENIKMPAVGIGVLSATSGTCSKSGTVKAEAYHGERTATNYRT